MSSYQLQFPIFPIFSFLRKSLRASGNFSTGASIFIRLLICILVAGLVLYKYIDKLNELTELQLSVPALAKEVRELNERNLELQYEIEQFESPIHLMELARKPEFGHLKYPKLNEIIILPENPEIQ